MLNPASYTSVSLPSVQSVRDLVNLSPNSITQGHAFTEWIVEVFHNDFSPWLLDDGTNDATKYFIPAGSSIQWNRSQDVQRTCTVSFDGALATQLNTLTALIKISRAYYDHNGNSVLLDAHGNPPPRGLFRFDIPDRDILNDTGDTIMKVTGFDLSRDLTRIFPIHPLVVPMGLNVGVVIHALLRQDNRTVAEGGRAPSGIAVAGGSQAGLPSLTGPVSGTYSASGVDVTTYSVDAGTGYLKSPDGPFGFVFYNPYGGARADATTHAPIDPWTGVAMTPLPSATTGPGGATNIWLASRAGIAYNSAIGAFYQMSSASVLNVSYQWDVFKSAPVPSMVVYKQPDIAHPPSGTIGSAVPPLASWPYDGIDGSGPYFGSTPALPTTVASGNPDGMTSLLYAHVMAQRTSNIDEVVVPTGTWNTNTGTTQTDPQNPGVTEIVPDSGGPVFIDGMLAVNQTFPAAPWTINVMVQGFGLKSGQVGIGSCDVYWKDASLVYHHLGTLVPGDSSAPFAASPLNQNMWCSASGVLPGFTTDIGGQIAIKVELSITQCVGNYSSGATSIANLTFRGFTTGPGNHGTGSGTTTPTASGTTIPWPQTTFPALAPNGCPVFGANLGESLIDLPTTTAVTGTTYTWDKQTSLNAFINQLCALANWYPLSRDEAGIARTKAMPYYATDGLPAIEWTFSNENPPTDGLLNAPVTQRLGDQTGTWNVVEVEAQQNADGEGLVSVQENNDPTSIISFANLGRREIKIVDASELTTQEQVDTRAFLELQLAATGANALELQVPLNPFFSGNNDVINVIVIGAGGVHLIDGSANPFLVSAWSEEAESPLMRIVCGNTVSLDAGGVTVEGGIGGAIGGPIG